MKVINLIDTYKKVILKNKNLDAYVRSYPSLFEHYFVYWGDKGSFFNFKINEEEVNQRLQIVESSLPIIERKLGEAGFDTKTLRVILFVGQDTTNGHAFLDGDEFVVWLPIESYSTLSRAITFITHEIIHAFHYQNSPWFYFHNKHEKQLLGRQLITEGIATYISKIVLHISDSETLWSDFLSMDEIQLWMNKCQSSLGELKKIVRDTFRHSEDSKMGLFYANDPNNIFEFRSGYFLGLKMIEWIICIKHKTLIDILKMNKNEIEKFSMEYLNIV